MKKLLFLLALIPLSLDAQLNISFLGQVNYQTLHSTGLSNLWGYVDELGNEYAVVGTNDGVSVVNVTNPTAPAEVFFVPGTNSIWREVRTYNNYAYITTEAHDGMMIINLNPLPGALSMSNVTYFNGPAGNPWISAHSLHVDENGVLFLHGTNRGNGGVILYDLNSSPTSPTELGQMDTWYVHDSYARGDTLYSAHINDGFFSIANVSNPAAITLISANQNTPKNFTHNCWLSANGDYLFTTDEVSGAWIGAYDISDLSNITEVDRIRHSETSGSIPHNTYWLNNYLVTSYYRDGVTIHDVTNPANMIEVGNYDTSPLSGDGFDGAWGVYPFLPSGNLLVSDMQLGLFILGPTYTRASYLEGVVTDAVSSANLNNVQVDILTTTNFDQSDLSGFYSTGHAVAGTYNVVYSKAGYISDTVSVSLVSGTTVTQNVALQPIANIALTGTVTNGVSGLPVSNVQIEITNSDFTYTVTTDGSGNYTISPFFLDPASNTFDVTVGAWGYITHCQTGVVIDAASNPLNFALQPGYYDDFAFDFGWSGLATASSGFWVRDKPFGSLLGISYSNPNEDIDSDCGDKAYVTGNANDIAAGTDDIDNGSVTLTSPPFDITGIADAYAGYYLWFRNGGGSGTPNDTVSIYIYDGVNRLVAKKHLGNTAEHLWLPLAFRISDFTAVTTNLRFVVVAEDSNPGHVLEAGIDKFQITSGNPYVGIEEIELTQTGILVYPNPANSNLTVSSTEAMQNVQLYDMTGKCVLQQTVNAQTVTLDIQLLGKGIYTLRTTGASGTFTSTRVVKQ